MKKVTYLFLTAIIALMLVPTSSAFAYSGGLLSGQPVVKDDGTTVINTLTDGDESTGIVLARLISGQKGHQVIASASVFDRWNVTGYQIKGDGSKWEISFRATDNSILKAINPITSDGQQQTIAQVSNVAFMEVSNLNGVSATLYEMDIFGSVVHLTPQLSLSSIGDKAVSLSWTPLDAAKGYNVYRSTTSGGPYTKLGSTNSTTTSYTDVTTDNNTTYYYVVTATNSDIESVYSNEVSATSQSSNKALLTITMTNGIEKEYDLSMDEVNDFIDWFDAKGAGSGPTTYSFNKNWNIGPFKARTEYVIFDKILTFNVDEYDPVQ